MNIGLVGQTNAGKSSIFNRLIGQFRAIVTDIPGTTRDILRHPRRDRQGRERTFFDSPGLDDFEAERPFIQFIIDHSDILLFVVDDSHGFTARDARIRDQILATGKKNSTILIVNKLDKNRQQKDLDLAIADYFQHGFSVIGASAEKKFGIEEIRRELEKFYAEKFPQKTSTQKPKNLSRKNRKKLAQNLEDFPANSDENSDENFGETSPENSPENSNKNSQLSPKNSPIPERPRIAIIGKPNAGKSTLMNFLMKSAVSTVSDTPGTTRDYVSGDFDFAGKSYQLFDTAGIKRRGHMKWIDKISYTKTKSMLEFTRPLVFFVIDALERVTHRDLSLLDEILQLHCPVVVLLNKRDAVQTKRQKTILRETTLKLEFARSLPIFPISAATGDGLKPVFRATDKIFADLGTRIETKKLTDALLSAQISKPARFPKNKICKIYFAMQVAEHPPRFVIFVNDALRANFSFKKRAENVIRQIHPFFGRPLDIEFRTRRSQTKNERLAARDNS